MYVLRTVRYSVLTPFVYGVRIDSVEVGKIGTYGVHIRFILDTTCNLVLVLYTCIMLQSLHHDPLEQANTVYNSILNSPLLLKA